MVNPTIPAPLEFDAGINKRWPGEKLLKLDPRWRQHTASFHQERPTIDSLIRRVALDGCVFSGVMRNSNRNTENFLSAQLIGLDDDRGTQESTLDALGEDPFIASRAACLYETPSSTSGCPKARIVFVLDEPFTDADEYRAAQEAMWWKYGATDSQVKEPARFFYGRVNARHINLDNVLYRDVLQEEVIEPYLREHPLTRNGHRLAEPVGETIPERARNGTLTSMAGSMRWRGFCQASIDAALLIEDKEKCYPPLSEEEVLNIARSVGRYTPGNARSTKNNHSKIHIPSMVIG